MRIACGLRDHSETTARPQRDHSGTTTRPQPELSGTIVGARRDYSGTTAGRERDHSGTTEGPQREHSETTTIPQRNHSETPAGPQRYHNDTTTKPQPSLDQTLPQLIPCFHQVHFVWIKVRPTFASSLPRLTMSAIALPVPATQVFLRKINDFEGFEDSDIESSSCRIFLALDRSGGLKNLLNGVQNRARRSIR